MSSPSPWGSPGVTMPDPVEEFEVLLDLSDEFRPPRKRDQDLTEEQLDALEKCLRTGNFLEYAQADAPARRERRKKARAEALRTIAIGMCEADLVQVFINRARAMPGGPDLSFRCPECGGPVPAVTGCAESFATWLIGGKNPADIVDQWPGFVGGRIFEIVGHSNSTSGSPSSVPCPARGAQLDSGSRSLRVTARGDDPACPLRPPVVGPTAQGR